MKKLLKNIFISLLIYFALFGFMHDIVLNNSRNAVIELSESQIYTDEELKMATHIVKEKFRSFPAKLEKIWYDEEKSAADAEYFKNQYSVDEVLILYSNFWVKDNKRALNSGFETGMRYTNWMWVMVRNDSGRWELKTYGY